MVFELFDRQEDVRRRAADEQPQVRVENGQIRLNPGADALLAQGGDRMTMASAGQPMPAPMVELHFDRGSGLLGITPVFRASPLLGPTLWRVERAEVGEFPAGIDAEPFVARYLERLLTNTATMHGVTLGEVRLNPTVRGLIVSTRSEMVFGV